MNQTERLEEKRNWLVEDAVKNGKTIYEELVRKAGKFERNHERKDVDAIRYDLDFLISSLQQTRDSLNGDIIEINKFDFALKVLKENENAAS